MTTFYDTHAHLDFPDFAEDLPEVLSRARGAGLARVITVGTDLQSSQRAIALSERYAEVYAVVGWHPGEAVAAPDDLRPELRALARHPKVVALGETGLDYHRLPSATTGGTAEDDARTKGKQADLFRQHLEVAVEVGLNCVIHQRDAWADTLRIMEDFAGRVRGVFHCFGEDQRAMEQVLALGALVSYTGIVTFKNASRVRETVSAVPADRFMLETDCPYLAPVPYRGKRCEPAHVVETAAVVAALKGWTLEELSRVTCATAHAFFSRLALPA